MSGFFGVTSLGPGNPIGANLLSTLGVTSFSDEEFYVAFKSLSAGDMVRKTDVYELCSRCYGFEPMPEELNLFVDKMNLSEDGEISWQEFKDGLAVIRETVRNVAKNAKHFISVQDLHDDRNKQKRVKFGPMEMYKRPMTTQQAVGWHEEQVHNERYPKRQCAETVYADIASRNKSLGR